jgi:hypothetical protein
MAGLIVYLEMKRFIGGLPGAGDDFADAAHGLGIRAHHTDGAEVMENVLGGDSFTSNAAFGKGHILGQVRIEVVADHQHVQVLVQRVDRVRARRVSGTGQDIGFAANANDIRSMAAAGAFGMVSVNRAAFNRGDSCFEKTRFVERIGVNGHLHILFVGDAQAAINRCRGCSPVFMKLEADGAAEDLLRQSGRQRGISFARKTEV